MKMNEIDELLKQVELDELPAALESFREDSRVGVQKLIQKYEKRLMAHEKERLEWQLKCDFDAVFHEGQKGMVGIDEVGRGPLAGPVVAAAVILPYETKLLGLKDSKKLTEAKRESLYDEIMEVALGVGIGIVDADVIDEINILQATFKAMTEAISKLEVPYELVLVDGDKKVPTIDCAQEAIIGGDDKSASIAAASVIAKVTRDRMMKAYANTYEAYDWESNKGYGSSKHYEALETYGLTPLHRRSFLKNFLK